MPTVSIALPVYNGERYLRQALDSILAQSFTDFEVLIADNASTDATAEIAAEYAARDPRIRYHRNPQNLGAAGNFNLAFQLTSGRYFKWAAHDDLLHPDFLQRCVAALERDPGAVLAFPRSCIIDEDGEPQGDYEHAQEIESPSCAVRFGALLEYHRCFEVFGVIRRDALAKTRLIGPYAHGDGVLLANLALHGRFVKIPESLFFPRRHDKQSSTMVGDYWNYAAWFNPAFRGKRTFPHWRLFGEYFRTVLFARAPLSDRVTALRVLSRVLAGRSSLLRGDLLFYLRPRLVAAGVPERLLSRSQRGR